jgi:hypothetical protein
LNPRRVIDVVIVKLLPFARGVAELRVQFGSTRFSGPSKLVLFAGNILASEAADELAVDAPVLPIPFAARRVFGHFRHDAMNLRAASPCS